METPFATWVLDDVDVINNDASNFRKYVEFALFKLPTMLEHCTSYPVCQRTIHRRNRSFISDVAGIVMKSPSKCVSFGGATTFLYKADLE